MEKLASWRYVSALLVLVGALAASVILASVFWLTYQVNRMEETGTRNAVQLYVADQIERLKLSTADYAHWTLAYTVVVKKDAPQVYEQLGSGATQSDLFDQIFILTGLGELVFAFGGALVDGEQPPAPPYDAKALAPYIAALELTEVEDYTSISGFAVLDARVAAVSVTRITPDDFEGMAQDTLPIMVGVVFLSEERLAGIPGQDNQSFAASVGQAAEGAHALSLLSWDGTPVGALNWAAASRGSILRSEVLPGILIVCASILGICLVAGRYYYRLSQSLERAREIATTDQLTGLLNRAGVDDVLHDPKFQASLRAAHVAVIYLDLNDFKDLNDSYGHKNGDIALKVTAERLQSAVRAGDFVARLGGDEFVCLVVDAAPEQAAIDVSNRFVDLTRSPILFSGHEQVLQASVGISIASSGLQWETILAQSDAAMYWAKKKKIKDPIVFCRSMHDGQHAA